MSGNPFQARVVYIIQIAFNDPDIQVIKFKIGMVMVFFKKLSYITRKSLLFRVYKFLFIF